MQLFWSLFRRDVATMPRKGRFYWKRVAFALACAILVFVAFTLASAQNATLAGLVVFRNLSFLLVLWACLVAPHTAAQALAAERENRLLGLLLLTDLNLWQLLMGKLCFAMWRTLLGVLAALPMVMLCVSLGGVSTQQIWLAAAVLLSTIFAGTCLGLLAATLGRRDVQASNLVIVGIVIGFIIAPLVIYVLGKRQVIAEEWAIFSSPALALHHIIVGDQAEFALIRGTCLLLLGAGLLLMVATVIALPLVQLAREDGNRESAPISPIQRAAQHQLLRHVLRWLRNRENALLWREFYIVYGGFGRSWQRFGLILTACLGLLAFGMINTKGSVHEYSLLIGVVLAALAGLLLIATYTSSAARMFHRERQAGTLDILLCTSMPQATIVNAKLGAIYLMLIPWLLTLAIGLAWTFANLPSWNLRGTYLLIVIYALATWYAYSGIVLYLGSRMTRHVEVLSMGFLVLWLTLGQTVLAALGAYLFFIGGLFGPAAFILGPIGLGYGLRRLVKGNLRRYVLMQQQQ